MYSALNRKGSNMVRLWIKDLTDGKVHEYGTDRHDALIVRDGVLEYINMQNGDGSPAGYCFCNEDGTTDWFENAKEGYTETYVDIGGHHCSCAG